MAYQDIVVDEGRRRHDDLRVDPLALRWRRRRRGVPSENTAQPDAVENGFGGSEIRRRLLRRTVDGDEAVPVDDEDPQDAAFRDSGDGAEDLGDLTPRPLSEPTHDDVDERPFRPIRPRPRGYTS